MADAAIHPKAIEHLPFFITTPGETDTLMVIMAWFLLFSAIGFGVFYFRLHSLPEHIAHKTHKVQMEIVSVLCLIALFTHEHIFWIAGLILAFIDLPDFGTPLRQIAGSVGKIAGEEPQDPEAQALAARTAHADQHGSAGEPPADARKPKPGDATRKPAGAASEKESSHA